MKKLLVSALALGAMSSAALAGPAKLSDNQLGQIAAGQSNTATITATTTNTSSISQSATATSSATCTNCTGTASATASGPDSTAAAAGIEVSSSASAANFARVVQFGVSVRQRNFNF